MSNAAVIPGWIKDNGGDTPRKASSIKYTVSWEFPSGPDDWPNCKPHDQRPPDQINGKDVETIPLGIGSWVVGVLIENQTIWWSAHERVAFAECAGSPPGGGSGNKKIMTGPGGNILPDDGGGGTQGAPGGGGGTSGDTGGGVGGIPP